MADDESRQAGSAGVEPVLDDAGLLSLLKFPAGTDLEYYRRHVQLPYLKFRLSGVVCYRYITSEVMSWLRARQHHGRFEA